MAQMIAARPDRTTRFMPRGGALPDETWRTRHRAIVVVAWAQIPLLLVVGSATGTRIAHLLLETTLVALAAYIATIATDRLVGSVTATFALVTSSALLVHLSHGLIEMHFHFFVVVAIITLYQDWRPFLVGLAYVVVHHALFGTLHPHDVYNHAAALNNPRLWALIHGAFILAASAAGIANWRFNERLTGRLESSLRRIGQSEARFRSLIQNSFDVVGVLNDQLTFTYLSPAVTAATGHKPEDLVGRTILELTHPDDLVRVKDALTELTARNGASASFEARLLGHGSGWTWVELRASNHLADAEIDGIVLNYHNVTARRLAQTENDKLAALVGASPDAILTMTTDGVLTAWNDGATKLYGYTETEMVGRHVCALVPPEEEKAMHDVTRKVAAGESVEAFDATRLHKDGTERQVSLTFFPLCDEKDAVTGIASIERDISDRFEAERAQNLLQTQLRQAQKMQSIGQLAGGVAHDFNNILAIVLNYATFLRDDVDDPRAKEDVEEIIKASKRGAALVRQLLLFSRKEVVKPENLDPNGMIRDAEQLLRRTMGEDVEISFYLIDDVPSVFMDPSQLDQILINLAVNARDAMTAGGRFTISTSIETLEDEASQVHPEMAPGSYVCLTFSDSGHGMSKDLQGQIFDPFFTTKPRGEGTGLGLATVYGIIKQAGGFIYVYSEVGKGTTFRIYLPPSTGTASAVRGTDSQPAVELGGTEKVLLVEDDRALRNMVQRILTGAGYEVIAAADPTEALHASTTLDELHLLLTDVVMPVMTGRALADAIWKRRGPTRVLFMSGYTTEVVTRRGELEEGIALLQKPFSSTDLLRAVRETLDTGPTAMAPSATDLGVLIVDDEPAFRDFLKAVIDDIAHVREAVTAANGPEALELYAEHKPRIVFLDSLSKPMTGEELAARIRDLPGIPPSIVAVTASGRESDKPWADSIIHKGARLIDEIARVIKETR